MYRSAIVLALLFATAVGSPARAAAEDPADARNHAVQLGVSAVVNAFWSPVPGGRAEVTWLRRYAPRHGYWVRLESGFSVADAGDTGEREKRLYTATVAVGMREWLGPRRRGFVEMGLRLGAAVVRDRRYTRPQVYIARELLTAGVGVALGKHHDVDLMFTTGWGYPSGGGFVFRFPLWHQRR